MGAEPSLYEGDAGVDGWVETLQLALRRAGQEPGPIDGKFGWQTARAVVAFQEQHQLQNNGVVGNQTWAALMERDPEPPGVNNGSHGGLYPPQPHAAPAPTIPGAGWVPEPAQLMFTSAPAFDSNEVQVDLDVQSDFQNLAIVVWAELVQNGEQIESARADVRSTGTQHIPFLHSYPPGEYDVYVHATDNAGTTIDTSARVTLP